MHGQIPVVGKARLLPRPIDVHAPQGWEGDLLLRDVEDLRDPGDVGVVEVRKGVEGRGGGRTEGVHVRLL